MATFTFIQQSRPKNSNQPLTYTIAGPAPTQVAGTLKKQKNKWRMHWLGVAAEFDTKIQLRRHFQMLGHQTAGLD